MEECIANIGPRGRLKRLGGGLLSLIVAIGFGFFLAGSAAWLRPLIFLPLLGAAYGLFQYREKT